MKRIIDHFLLDWKEESDRKSLILRGARQVGKTYAARQLGKTFNHFVEINLETDEEERSILTKDLKVERMITQLSEIHGPIVPGSTLLFIDEIQQVPQAITALRYFYEKMPDLHVIAAGSLLDFALEQVGIPVGRVSELYMYPLSFLEFLAALGHKRWIKTIISPEPVFKELHGMIIDLVGMYLAIGGMPAAINKWQREKNTRLVKKEHARMLNNYIIDFDAYAKKHQIKYLKRVFNKAMEQLSRKLVFSQLGEYQKRELEPAVDLLEKAGILYRVFSSNGQGIPLGDGMDYDDYKVIFLDVGLTQALLGFNISKWIIKPLETFVNKGEIVEAFVGQELLAYSDPIMKENLFYWRKSTRGSQAKIDYLIQLGEQITPVEVKAGKSTHLKSMHFFLNTHPKLLKGIRFWADVEQKENSIHSYPLYSVVKPLLERNEYLQEGLNYLIAD